MRRPSGPFRYVKYLCDEQRYFYFPLNQLAELQKGNMAHTDKIEVRARVVAEHLENEAKMAAYLDAALEDGDVSVIVAALGDIARAKGMTQIVREAGLGRESLYKALSTTGNPEFATILKVVRALGLPLHVELATA